MMPFAQLVTPAFAAGVDPETSRRLVIAGVYGLALQNMVWLKANPGTIRIYDSGVVWRPEPKGVEKWLSVPYILAAGKADCEDLAAWRVAELRVRDRVHAIPEILVRTLPDGRIRAHAVVKWPDGRIEDPSAKMGMHEWYAAHPGT
jgi:hypothetical protein